MILEGKEIFKKMMVALDGSEHADHALDFALDLAEKHSANVVLISVYHLSTLCYTALEVEVIQNCLEAQKVQHENVLSEALKKVKKLKPNLKVSTKLLKGRPADRIIETAKEENFDIIVMGSRGLTGVKRFLLGGVTDRVVHHAPCSVMVVKTPE